MILVDSSVWIDHLRHGDRELAALLEARSVMSHPFVIGELACGWLSNRGKVLAELAGLPVAPLATNDETLGFLERHRLPGRGIGWVDAHLLASAQLIGGEALFTRDKRLRTVAMEMGLAMQPAQAR
ncbi:MAG: type II toxin-antitoxin system VapC family toxin [Proteobacteria bacterium]|nr:type II toxin-antitoxin system VapC family toxin [Pseudomonadota bacterium]